MDNNEEQFGAGMSLFAKLQLLSEWSPLLTRAEAIMSAQTPQEKALAVVSAARWAAGKTTSTQIDDEALEHIEAVLKSPEGAAAYAWLVAKIKGAGA